MSRKQSKGSTSRRTFLTRVGTYAWGAAVSLTSLRLLVRPSRAWAQDPETPLPPEGSGQPATMPTEPTSQPTSQPTTAPTELGGPDTQPTRTAEVTPVLEEDLDQEFGFVEVVEEPRTRSGGHPNSRGCIVRESCSSGDIAICERANNGECGESNFCQEHNTGDCDRVNGCRNLNDGSCGERNLCNAPNS